MRWFSPVLALVLLACSADHPCDDSGAALPSRQSLWCWEEFAAQAARPLDSSLPGALSVKTIIDQSDADKIHFQNTAGYPLHRTFAVEHLGWPPGSSFVEQYYFPQRRFLLGSITHYEEPNIWAYELAPYDTATPEMITKAYRLLAKVTYFGGQLAFHPTSEAQEARAEELPSDVRVVTTDDIYGGTTYQPLNLGETLGQVRVLTLAELSTRYVSPREIVVLDRVPNDISVVAGLITEEFQTPLSHVNVLSQQRGTPNMALVDARTAFSEHDAQWVRLTVGAFSWSVESVTQQETDAWWQQHRPSPVPIPDPDLSRTGLIDLDLLSLSDIPAVGGKAAHFGELRQIPAANARPGFAIPVFYYQQFLVENGFDVEIAAMLLDANFRADGLVRKTMLAELQTRMAAAPLNAAFETLLIDHLNAAFPGTRMRFRSSTTAEDLNGFSGAGLYSSGSGDPNDPTRPVAVAVRKVWAGVWNFPAFEEREYVSIDHMKVKMGVLVIPTYRGETANGVGITANMYDPGAGGEDAFYVNVQVGEESVVSPGPGVVSDQLMYFYFHQGAVTYYTHSNLVAPGTTVLTARELFDLGRACSAIREHFAPIYDPPTGFGQLPMDIEFKRVGIGGTSRIEIKQARPYPGRGQ